jgi:uncharacterized protein
MTYPIPRDALDDRLAIVGTAGSGKTYLALGAIEHLFAKKARVIAIDPLGVMWGLRLCADGKSASPFQPVIFGGLHGDLPITEHAGALIGSAVATSPESCIVDLSQLGTKASERRFMLALLTALYRDTNKEPVHVIIDEADMFAPQRLLDKDGDAAKLLGMMETVVRRGRARGFIPWLITQRPAVLSKDVLSQADGLIALKLTAKQDRDAIGGWIEGQADAAEGKAFLAGLPIKQRGEAVLWLPGRGILANVTFPPKATFDSSRTPKRGEKLHAAELKPLDLGALKSKLVAVEAETKANDPKALKAEVARLKAELAKKPMAVPSGAPASEKLDAAHERGVKEAKRAYRKLLEVAMKILVTITTHNAGEADKESLEKALQDALTKAMGTVNAQIDARDKALTALQASAQKVIDKITEALASDVVVEVEVTANKPFTIAATPVRPAPPVRPKPPFQVNRSAGNGHDVGLSRPQAKILESLAWWAHMGHDAPTRAQTAIKAGMKARGGHFKTRLSELSGKGYVIYPSGDQVSMTPEGAASAPSPNIGETIVQTVRPLLSAPQAKIFDSMLSGNTQRDAIAADAGMDVNGGHFKTRLSELSSFEIVEYPDKGSAKLQDWVTA